MLIKRDTWTGSNESLGDTRSQNDRGGSATSKFSQHSCDSGFEDREYQAVVTEFSNANAVKEVEDGFNTPRDLGQHFLFYHILSRGSKLW